MYYSKLFLILLLSILAYGQKDPYFIGNRSTMVHLFEWKWLDIADECEHFLKDHGYGGVQISPPNEYIKISLPNLGRTWYERYQPISYQLVTRSGNEEDFKQMTRRCNDAGVRIYVDIVINHMTGQDGTGTNGNYGSSNSKSYSAIPYGWNDFHDSCSVNNYNDPSNVRNCELVGLKDLNQGTEYVRGKIVDFLNKLIDLGVAGFRVDAAKHIWPADLSVIYSRAKNLNTNYGFPNNARPFIYQEVSDFGTEAIKREEYTPLGVVTEFRHGASIGNVFQGNDKLTYLSNWGTGWGFMDSKDALVFVDNHDTQRSGDSRILTYKNSKKYKMAVAFMLAHPYGQPRVMSSFSFDDSNAGPPQDSNGNIVPAGFNSDNTCTNGWICEHRWRQIYNMAKFRQLTLGKDIKNWWSNGDQQIAFCRGDIGFIAFTNSGDIAQDLDVCLPSGKYCDIISGDKVNGKCTGKIIEVRDGNIAWINLRNDEYDGMIAIYKNSKL